jgi:hypothetical protein
MCPGPIGLFTLDNPLSAHFDTLQTTHHTVICISLHPIDK